MSYSCLGADLRESEADVTNLLRDYQAAKKYHELGDCNNAH